MACAVLGTAQLQRANITSPPFTTSTPHSSHRRCSDNDEVRRQDQIEDHLHALTSCLFAPHSPRTHLPTCPVLHREVWQQPACSSPSCPSAPHRSMGKEERVVGEQDDLDSSCVGCRGEESHHFWDQLGVLVLNC